MVANKDNLPDDVEALKALLREKERVIAKLNDSVERITTHADALQEKLNLLLAKRFGPSSEKSDKHQLGLFNEAEAAVEGKRSINPVLQITPYCRAPAV